MKQQLIFADKDYALLTAYLQSVPAKRALLVHGKSMMHLAVGQYLLHLREQIGLDIVEFTDFTANPDIWSAVRGAKVCRDSACDMIIACGGGSAMDVAKCIRLFCEMDMSKSDFLKDIRPGKLPFVVIPTTAGTGSDATHFAVVYQDGKKLSVAELDNIPQAVVLDAAVLENLPLRQKQATYLDAMCHAIESYWSVHATEESRVYAREALRLLCAANPDYLLGQADNTVNMSMLLAAHYAGKAINISKTTAAHAMCYKLTGLFGVPHGQAAALCLCHLWPYMQSRMITEDASVQQSLRESFAGIAEAMGCESVHAAIIAFQQILKDCAMDKLNQISGENDGVIAELAGSVNVQRLQNHPLHLTADDFSSLYRAILEG